MNRTGIVWPLIGSLAAFSAIGTEGQQGVARVDFAKGQVKALQLNQEPRTLAAGGDVYVNDLVETGDHSFTLLAFTGVGKAMVRPNSLFSVSHFSTEKGETTLALDKGGVAMDTGNLSAKGPDRLSLDTPLGRINAQQAKFKVRLCKKDCAEDAGDADVPREVIGRVVDQRGEAKAISQDEKLAKEERALMLGAAVYRSDYLVTGPDGQVTVAFRDGGRMALGPDAKMSIDDYRYQEKGSPDMAVFRMVRGGLRAVSGQLGKAKPEEYSLSTPVATIGIRGTAFDLQCNCGCEGQAGAGEELGLYAAVRKGAIVVRNDKGETPLREGESAYIKDWQGTAQRLASPPPRMAAAGEGPEGARVDAAALFGEERVQGAPPGLYLFVEEGHVHLEGKVGEGRGEGRDLGRNEAVYVDETGRLIRLGQPKQFQVGDDLPQPPRKVGEMASPPT